MNIPFRPVAITILITCLCHLHLSAEARLSGRVVKRNGENVTLNIGYDAGAKVGKTLSVYAGEKQVALPLSGNRTLINSEAIAGEIQIIRVENNTSEARIIAEDARCRIEPLCYAEEPIRRPLSNNPPVISSMRTKPERIIPGMQVVVEVDVFDPDADPLQYAWKADNGYFLLDNTTRPVNCWVVPFDEAVSRLTVRVCDGRGGEHQMKIAVPIENTNHDQVPGSYQWVRSFKELMCNGEGLQVLDADFDSENNLYILDPKGRCVRIFSPKGEYLRTFGNGEFIYPNELLIARDKIYVIYNNNKQFRRYGLQGNLEVDYTRMEPTEYDIDVVRKPVACAVGNEGELYVVDGKGPAIVVFEPNGRFRARFGNNRTEAERLLDPVAVTVDREGYIYVLYSSDREEIHKKGEILMYNPRMQFEKGIPLEWKELRDMFFDKAKNHLYLLTSKNVLMVDTKGKSLGRFGELRDPCKIVMDKFGDFYTTNKSGNCVYKFIHTEDSYTYYGKFWTEAFADVTDIAADKNSSVFLLHGQSGEIVKVDKHGWELGRFGGKTSKGGNLEKPASIVAGRDGMYVYVLDKDRKEVVQFSHSGEFLRVIAGKEGDRVKDPIAIDSDKDGNVYVLDAKMDVCFLYDSQGRFVTQIGTKGNKKTLENLYKPAHVAVAREGGTVYIFDDNSAQRKINLYTKKDSSTYEYLKYWVAPKETENLKVNHYGYVMGTDASDHEAHRVVLYHAEGEAKPVLSGINSFMTVKDLDIDGVENLYILNNAGDVNIYKQQGLLSTSGKNTK